MRGNLDRRMGFRTVQLMAAAVSVILVLCVTTGIIGAFGKTDDGSYVLQDRSTAELMGDFGVICFDTLNVQTHLHSNFITKTLNADSNSGLRNSYGVYEEFYFENAEKMNGCVSDVDTDTLYTGADIRRAEDGRVYIIMNNGSEIKLDRPANVKTDAELAGEGQYSKYADMSDIQRRFIEYSQELKIHADTEETVYIDLDGDINNRRIAVKGDGMHVVSLGYNELSASTNPIYFEFPDYDGDTVLLMNIDLSGTQDAVFGDMILGSKNDATANDNGNYFNACNRMYFNFYDSSAADGQFSGSITFSGRGFGTVLAPKASVNLGHNWDGCVVSEVLSNGGEFHRVPGIDFPKEEPTTESTTTEDTTTEDTTTENTTTEDTTTEDTTTEDTTTEDTTTEDTTTEDTTTEDTTTEDTTTEDTTTEDTTTEDTTTEDTTTETTTGTTTELTTTEGTTTEQTTWSTTGTTVTMTTTRSIPPGRHPDTGDRLPLKEIACVIVIALMGSVGVVIYKKVKKYS